MAREIPDVAPRSIGDQKVVPVRVNGKPMMMALSEFAALTGKAVGSERNDNVQLSTWQDVTHAAKVAEAEESGAAKAVGLGAASGITWGLGPMATLAAAEALGDKGLKRELAEEMAVLREAHGGKALLVELAAAMGPQALEMIGARMARGAAGAGAGAAASAPTAPAAGGGAAALPAAPATVRMPGAATTARMPAAQGTARAGAGGGSTLGGVRAASAQPLEGELAATLPARGRLYGPEMEGTVVRPPGELPGGGDPALPFAETQALPGGPPPGRLGTGAPEPRLLPPAGGSSAPSSVLGEMRSSEALPSSALKRGILEDGPVGNRYAQNEIVPESEFDSFWQPPKGPRPSKPGRAQQLWDEQMGLYEEELAKLPKKPNLRAVKDEIPSAEWESGPVNSNAHEPWVSDEHLTPSQEALLEQRRGEFWKEQEAFLPTRPSPGADVSPLAATVEAPAARSVLGELRAGKMAEDSGARAVENIVSDSPDLGFFSYPKEARQAIRGGKVKPNAAELREDLAAFEREMAGTPGFENQRNVLLHDLQKQAQLEEEFINARGAERAADVGAQDLKTGVGGGGLMEANPDMGAKLRAAALGPEGLIPSVEGRALNEAVGTLRGGKVGGSTIGEMREAALRSGIRGSEQQAADAAAVRAGIAERKALELTPEQIARNAERVEGPAFQQEAKDLPGQYLNKPLSDDPEMQARIQEILAQIEGKEARGKALATRGPDGMSGPPSGDFVPPGGDGLPPGPPGLSPAAGAGGSGGGSLPPAGGGAGPGGAALSPAGQNVLAAMQVATQQGATPLQAAQAVAKAQQQTIVQGMAQASGVLPSALRSDLGQAFIQGAASQIENDLVADRPVAVGAAVANGLAGVALAGAASRAFSRVGGIGHSPTAGGPNVQTAGALGGTQEKLQKFIRSAAFQQLRPSAQTIKAARRLGVIDDIGEQLLHDVPRAMGKKSLAAMTPDEMLEGVTKLIERNGDAMGDILAVGNQAVRQGKARIEPAVKLFNSLEMMAQQAEQMVGFGPKVAEQIRIGRDHWAKAMGLRNSLGQFAADAATKPTDLRKLKDLSNWAKSLVYLGEAVPELRLDPVKKAFAGVRDLIETELSTMSDDVFRQIGKPGLAEKYAYIKQQYQASRFIAEMAEREAIANAKSNGTINKMANVIQGVVFGTAVMGGAGLETLFAGSARTVGQVFRENANRWAIAAAEKLAGGVAVSAERRVLQEALERGFQDFIDVDLTQAQKLAVKLPTAAQTAQMAVNIQNLANNPTALNNAAMQTAQNMGAVSPQMAQQVQDSFKAGVKTLAGFIPTAYQRMKYSDSTPQFDPYELKKFALALRAVTDPGSIAQDLARGQLSPTSWDALQKWDPELAINMQDQLRASLALARATKGKKFHWTPQKETAMATILKDADLPSLKPKTIKLNQATYMQLSGDASGGAPAAGGGKGPMAGGQGAAARMGGASFAKAYATGPQKTAFGGF